MSKIGRLCTEAAKSDPHRHFAVPRDVIGEVMLTRGEKLATLERWRLRVLCHLPDSNSATKSSDTDEQMKILGEIEEAKQRLQAEQ